MNLIRVHSFGLTYMGAPEHFCVFRSSAHSFSASSNWSFFIQAKIMGLPLAKYWARHFSTHMSAPEHFCVFAYPRDAKKQIAGIMLAEIGFENSVTLTEGSVLSEHQNEGLLQKMKLEVQKKFPKTNIVWCIRPYNQAVSRVYVVSRAKSS
eukprot:Phypoly_transcript_16633.p1 GENE.Phypoly_transcript_16633~~Phypoly_transcript_16633.p1  ORF type:complete len:151 (+),score=9.77 Phypoly_transcript_16633:306-758(+)